MRATVCFGITGVLTAVLALVRITVLFYWFPLAGLGVSVVMCRTPQSFMPRPLPAMLCVFGWGITGCIVLFSMISLQADIEPLWGAFSWGLGFGIAGAICGRSLSPPGTIRGKHVDRRPFAGLVATGSFAFSGALAGYLAFTGFGTWNLWALAGGLWLAFQLGGLLCDIGWSLSCVQSRELS